MTKERKAGVLLPISSLPAPYGIGTMGESAYRFIDWLKAAGMKLWQVSASYTHLRAHETG